MTAKAHNWITIHFAGFDDVPVTSETAFSAPPTASVWRCGPDGSLMADGFRSPNSKIWGGIGFYENQQDAQAALAQGQDALPFARQAAESWHALAGVVTHRGEIDLSTATEPHPPFTPLDTAPDGVLAVITSAGYANMSEADHRRYTDFLQGVERVRDYYRSVPANAMRQVFNPPDTPDGCTFTIWRGTPEMLKSAYNDGTHSDMLERHRLSPLFDRSSFTRLRILDSRGTWGGVNPAHDAA